VKRHNNSRGQVFFFHPNSSETLHFRTFCSVVWNDLKNVRYYFGRAGYWVKLGFLIFYFFFVFLSKCPLPYYFRINVSNKPLENMVEWLICDTIVFFSYFRDFLPRGSGIVTRRPLILQLINGPEGIRLLFFLSNTEQNQLHFFYRVW
jgi:hypothetical protein